MQPERMKPGEAGALCAMIGLIAAVAARFFAGEVIGVGIIILSGAAGAVIGVALGVITRQGPPH